MFAPNGLGAWLAYRTKTQEFQMFFMFATAALFMSEANARRNDLPGALLSILVLAAGMAWVSGGSFGVVLAHTASIYCIVYSILSRIMRRPHQTEKLSGPVTRSKSKKRTI